MKVLWGKFRSCFPSHKAIFAFELLDFIFLGLLFISLPLFTERGGYSIIPIILAGLFIVSDIVYAILNKSFDFPVFGIPLICFLIYSLMCTCITTQEWSLCKTLSLITILCVFIASFLNQTKKPLWGLWLYAFSGLVFAVCLFIDSLSSGFDSIFGRFGSSFGDLNSIGFFLSTWLGSVLALICFLHRPSKWVLLVVGLIALGSVALTGSRGAMVCAYLEVACFLFFILGKKKWWVSLLIVIGATAVGIITLSLIPSISLMDRFKEALSTIFGGSEYDASTALRIEMIGDGLSLFKDNAIFGYGLGGFAANTSYGTYSHATLIELLVSTGLFGTALFLFAFGYLAYRLFKDGKGMLSLMLLSLLIPELFFGVILYSKYFFVFMAIIGGFSSCFAVNLPKMRKKAN